MTPTPQSPEQVAREIVARSTFKENEYGYIVVNSEDVLEERIADALRTACATRDAHIKCLAAEVEAARSADYATVDYLRLGRKPQIDKHPAMALRDARAATDAARSLEYAREISK